MLRLPRRHDLICTSKMSKINGEKILTTKYFFKSFIVFFCFVFVLCIHVLIHQLWTGRRHLRKVFSVLWWRIVHQHSLQYSKMVCCCNMLPLIVCKSTFLTDLSSIVFPLRETGYTIFLDIADGHAPLSTILRFGYQKTFNYIVLGWCDKKKWSGLDLHIRL